VKWSFFKRREPCPASQPSARAVKSEPEALATQHTLPHSMPPSGDVKAAILSSDSDPTLLQHRTIAAQQLSLMGRRAQ